MRLTVCIVNTNLTPFIAKKRKEKKKSISQVKKKSMETHLE